MRYKVIWTMYFTDSNIPDTIAVAIVEASTVSKARYAAYNRRGVSHDERRNAALN